MLLHPLIDIPLLLALCWGGRRLRVAAGALLLAKPSAFAAQGSFGFIPGVQFLASGWGLLVWALVWGVILHFIVPRPKPPPSPPGQDLPPLTGPR